MADDQKPKTMDINDLVRELSKSSTSPVTPTPPLAPAPQAPRPSFPTPPSTSSQPSQGFGGQAGSSAKPPMSPPMTGLPTIPSMPKPSVPVPPIQPPVNPPLPKPVMPQPKFNVPPPPFNQPKPAPTPPSTPLPTPGVKEYQSSIRTMGEDISKIKQGQKPTGIDIPRKVEQVVPPIPQPMPPKPPVPSQQFKVPSVNLGEAQKTGPLAQSKDFSRPVAPPSGPIKPKAESKTKIYVPQEGQEAGNRNMLFIGIGAVAIVAGFAYWFFVLRPSVLEVVIETPTPTPTATPVQDLSLIFSGLAEIGTDVAYEDHQPTDQKGEFIRLTDNQNISSLILNWLNPPPNVKENLGSETVALLFVQSEFFDTKGQIKISDLERRLVLIVEAKDASLLTQATREWEATIVDGTSSFWNIDKSKQKSTVFLDNTYRGVGIRYKNFPYADRTIDYSVVPASNGKTYFVITNSREAILSAIDKLKGF